MKKLFSVFVIALTIISLNIPAASFAEDNSPTPVVDLCPNIEGNQADFPEGYKKIDNQCVKIVVAPTVPIVVYDFCDNYPGIQSILPPGFTRPNEGTTCVPRWTPENPDNTCPAGSWPVDGGECKLDVCSNLKGAHSVIPAGYEMKSPGICTQKPKPAPVVVDMCLNISGNQTKLPTGFTQYKGNCYKLIDMCWNLPETQRVVPTGYTAIDRTCSPTLPQ